MSFGLRIAGYGLFLCAAYASIAGFYRYCLAPQLIAEIERVRAQTPVLWSAENGAEFERAEGMNFRLIIVKYRNESIFTDIMVPDEIDRVRPIYIPEDPEKWRR